MVKQPTQLLRVLVPQGLFFTGVVIFLLTSTVNAAPKDKERWNKKYGTEEYVFGTEPIPFLRDNLHLLPKGKVLDLAMGEGRNGVYLATQGFEVTGLDISEKGIKKAKELAKQSGVHIGTKIVDLESYELPHNSYDVILCTYYLQRDLFIQIVQALKSGGVAVVETYSHEHLKYQPSFPRSFLLNPNELLDHFEGLTILRYQAVDDGKAAYASILVEKS